MTTTPSILPTLEDIRETIRNRPRKMQLKDVATATGVSVDWLNKLLAGEMPNAGYSRIKAVVDFVNAG